MTRGCVAPIGIAIGVMIAVEIASATAREPDADEYGLVACDEAGSPSHAIGVGLEVLAELELVPKGGLGLTSYASFDKSDCAQRIFDGSASLAITNSVDVESDTHPLAKGSGKRLFLISVLWHDVMHVMLVNEHRRSGTFRDLGVLSGDRIAIDPGMEDGAWRMLVDSSGATDVATKPVEHHADNLLREIQQGSLAGLAVLEPTPSSIVNELLEQLGHRVSLLELAPDQGNALDGGWHVRQSPPGIYPGIDHGFRSVARAVMLVANAEVSNESAYQLTKIMFEHLPFLAQVHDAARLIKLDRALAETSLPLHPGAARYYREVGVFQSQIGRSTNDFEAKGRSGDAIARSADAPKEAFLDRGSIAYDAAGTDTYRNVISTGRRLRQGYTDVEIFDVYFALGETALGESQLAELRVLAIYLDREFQARGVNPNIILEGHAYRSGSRESHQGIAHRRAASVRKKLIEEGIPEPWIKIAENDERRSTVRLDGNAQKPQDRRVEIKIVSTIGE